MGAHSRQEDLDIGSVEATSGTLSAHSCNPKQEWRGYSTAEESYLTAQLYWETEKILVRRLSGLGGDQFELQRIAEIEAELASAKLEIAYLRTQMARTTSTVAPQELESMWRIRRDLESLRKSYEEDQARLVVTISRGHELCAQLLDLLLAFREVAHLVPKD